MSKFNEMLTDYANAHCQYISEDGEYETQINARKALQERDKKLVEALKAVVDCYQDCSVWGALEIANKTLKELGELK